MPSTLLPLPLTISAQSSAVWQTADSIRLVTIIGILIVVIIVGGMLLMFLRRRMLARESAIDAPGSLMEELRRLKKRGVLTEAEYEATRRAATAGLRATRSPSQADSAPPPKAPRPRTATPLQSPDRIAKPGFDLTGAPLPKPADD